MAISFAFWKEGSERIFMNNLDDIFSAFKLGEAELQKLSNATKTLAISFGEKDSYKQLSSEAWDLLDDISEQVWTSTIPTAEKISLGFQLYDLFPSYYHFLVPFYRLIRDNKISDTKQKDIIWKRFMKYLVAENHYANPVAYVLWVEFFEDHATARESWQGLLNNYEDSKSLLRLLEISGPVPYDLKETVYNSLLDDEKTHDPIFRSLLHSAYDVFGQIDKTKALDVLAKLNVDTNTGNYRLLMDKLK
jgi:hypothetical protein